MKIQTIVTLAALVSAPAYASDVVPLNYIDSVDVTQYGVAMTAGDQTWQVTHGCDLSLSTESDITVRPAHKTAMMPHRMNRLGQWDSLVISVDGQAQTCPVDSIRRVEEGLVLN